MRRTTTLTLIAIGCATSIACRPAEAPPPAPDPALVKAAQIERGKYLVLLKKVEGGEWQVVYSIYNSDVPLAPLK